MGTYSSAYILITVKENILYASGTKLIIKYNLFAQVGAQQFMVYETKCRVEFQLLVFWIQCCEICFRFLNLQFNNFISYYFFNKIVILVFLHMFRHPSKAH